MNTNRYTFISKISGKPAKIGSASTRDKARAIKNITTRDVVIFDRKLGRVVR